MLKDYTIVSEIAQSANSTIFLAQAPHGQKVIIKAFRADLSGDMSPDEQILRFRRECDIHLFLKHERIVPAFECFDLDGVPHLVMEYKPYPSLRSLIDSRQPISLLEALSIVQKLCQALHYIHDLGIIHRDIKPQNILISEENKIFLTDFGCARKVFAPNITQTKLLQGTLFYMSPEQLVGRADIDSRADVFSAGVILYQLLTHELPFAGDDLSDIVQNLLSEEHRPLRTLNPYAPESLEKLVQQTLQKDPDYRMPTAKKLAQDIAHLLEDPEILMAEAQWSLEVRQAPERAKVFCINALKQDDHYLPALRMLGQLYEQSGHLERSRRCYERMIAREPGLAEPYFEIARLDNLEGFGEAAYQMYAQAWSLAPDNADYELKVAQTLQTLGRPEQALEHYQALMVRSPEWADPFHQAGRIYYLLGQKEAAVEHFCRARDLAPNHPEVLQNLASLLQELGYYQDALSLYQRLDTLHHSSPESQHNLANLYYLMGETGKARELLERLGQTHEWDKAPHWEISYILLGHCYSRLNLHTDAVDLYKCAIACNSNNLYTYFNLASALRATLRLEEAIQILKYAETQPCGVGQAELYFILSRAYHQQGKERETIQALEACLGCDETLTPAMAEQAHHDLAWVQEQRAETARQLRAVRRAQVRTQGTFAEESAPAGKLVKFPSERRRVV